MFGKKNFWMDLKVLFNFNKVSPIDTNQSDAPVAEGLFETLSLCNCGWGYFYWAVQSCVTCMHLLKCIHCMLWLVS